MSVPQLLAEARRRGAPIWRWLGALLIAGLAAAGLQPAVAEAVPGRSAPAALDQGRLPVARTTRHQLSLGDRTLAFGATAGAITLRETATAKKRTSRSSRTSSTARTRRRVRSPSW